MFAARLRLEPGETAGPHMVLVDNVIEQLGVRELAAATRSCCYKTFTASSLTRAEDPKFEQTPPHRPVMLKALADLLLLVSPGG